MTGPEGPPVGPDVTTDRREDEGGVPVVGARSGPEAVAVEPRTGVPTETAIFFLTGGFYGVLAVIYAAVGGDAAGIVMLVAGVVFAWVAAGYFWFRLRTVQQHVADAEAAHTAGSMEDMAAVDGAVAPPELYLPETSLWPLGIALGAGLVAAGVVIGWWVWLPGAALLAHSIVGFAAQSRDRTG